MLVLALDYQNQALALFQITGKRGAEVFTLTEIADADLSLEDKKRAINYLILFGTLSY